MFFVAWFFAFGVNFKVLHAPLPDEGAAFEHSVVAANTKKSFLPYLKKLSDAAEREISLIKKKQTQINSLGLSEDDAKSLATVLSLYHTSLIKIGGDLVKAKEFPCIKDKIDRQTRNIKTLCGLTSVYYQVSWQRHIKLLNVLSGVKIDEKAKNELAYFEDPFNPFLGDIHRLLGYFLKPANQESLKLDFEVLSSAVRAKTEALLFLLKKIELEDLFCQCDYRRCLNIHLKAIQEDCIKLISKFNPSVFYKEMANINDAKSHPFPSLHISSADFLGQCLRSYFEIRSQLENLFNVQFQKDGEKKYTVFLESSLAIQYQEKLQNVLGKVCSPKNKPSKAMGSRSVPPLEDLKEALAKLEKNLKQKVGFEHEILHTQLIRAQQELESQGEKALYRLQEEYCLMAFSRFPITPAKNGESSFVRFMFTPLKYCQAVHVDVFCEAFNAKISGSVVTLKDKTYELPQKAPFLDRHGVFGLRAFVFSLQ